MKTYQQQVKEQKIENTINSLKNEVMRWTRLWNFAGSIGAPEVDEYSRKRENTVDVLRKYAKRNGKSAEIEKWLTE